MSFLGHLAGSILPAAGAMAGGVFGPLIGAAGAGLGSYFANKESMSNQKSLMAYQSQLDQANWIQRFNMQNEYNTPTAMRQRLKDAGMNENLVYGALSPNMAANPSSSVPNAQLSKYQTAMEASLAQQQILSNAKDIELKDKDIEVKDSEIKLNNARAWEAHSNAGKLQADSQVLGVQYEKLKKQIESGRYDQYLQNLLGLQDVTMDKYNSEIHHLYAAIDEIYSRIDLNKEEIKVKQMQVRSIATNISYLIAKNEREEKYNNAAINQLGAIASYYIAQRDQIKQLTPYQIATMSEQLVGEILDHDLKAADIKKAYQVIERNGYLLPSEYDGSFSRFFFNLVNDAARLMPGGTPMDVMK